MYRINGQAAVLSEHPLSEMLRLNAGFQPGVFRKRAAGLSHLDSIGVIGERFQFDAERLQLNQFAELFAIARCRG